MTHLTHTLNPLGGWEGVTCLIPTWSMWLFTPDSGANHYSVNIAIGFARSTPKYTYPLWIRPASSGPILHILSLLHACICACESAMALHLPSCTCMQVNSVCMRSVRAYIHHMTCMHRINTSVVTRTLCGQSLRQLARYVYKDFASVRTYVYFTSSVPVGYNYKMCACIWMAIYDGYGCSHIIV